MWVSKSVDGEDIHGHSQRTLLRVSTSQGQPCNIQRMRHVREHLGPNNTKVADPLLAQLRENAIEDVAKQMHADGGDNGLSTLIARVNSSAYEEFFKGVGTLTIDPRCS